jgi:DNA-binding MarR family transcriptional regulator
MLNTSSDPNSSPIVNVSVTIADISVQFSGTPESVLKSVIGFITKQVPTISLATKISLNYSVTELIDLFSNFIKLTPEGPRVIIEQRELGNKRLSDKEAVALNLVATKIAKDLGKLPHEGMHLSEIQSASALNPKSISSRLSELVKTGYVSRENTSDGNESTTYKITTAGSHWLKSVLSKRLK